MYKVIWYHNGIKRIDYGHDTKEDAYAFCKSLGGTGAMVESTSDEVPLTASEVEARHAETQGSLYHAWKTATYLEISRVCDEIVRHIKQSVTVCECGGDKARTTHSDWCPKHGK